ncbi:CU044_2847 family protein [Actinoplanes aureus]|uniref:Trypsin-co-occurring domain-containing protein n=1 Tax=Actinoplanes aureus TaxID=2792083 RepID=A0A931CCX1_9ACTN|nr:CU044_2847 family protein [Actinoplanes aureus]MBG0562585.1 hypothetical protein [Actinoplanes aureus]
MTDISIEVVDSDGARRRQINPRHREIRTFTERRADLEEVIATAIGIGESAAKHLSEQGEGTLSVEIKLGIALAGDGGALITGPATDGAIQLTLKVERR